jgi:hypothetical protein
VRRGSIDTLKTQRCKKKFTASEIFFALRVARAAWRALPRRQADAPSAGARSIRCRNDRRRSAPTDGDALGRCHRQPRTRREHALLLITDALCHLRRLSSAGPLDVAALSFWRERGGRGKIAGEGCLIGRSPLAKD